MKAAKATKKKKTKSEPRAAKAPMFSTSTARANFAKALGMAHRDNTVVAFDRYGRRVAALVSMNAVLMLAGKGSEVPPAIREKIERMSKALVTATKEQDMPVAPAAKKKAPARGTRK
ncbi:MAG: hypothetical protein QM759_11180 [Terricaulis sp.]